MSMDYAQIVEGCRRHDAKAQRALYDAMAPMVGGVCARYAANHAEMQDLVQDVFIKVFERIGSLVDSERLGGWIYSMAVNTCIDNLRRRQRRVSLEDIEVDVPVVDTDPFAMEEILSAMQWLTPMLRAVFNLCDVEGYTLDEAAARLGSNNQAVRVALCRARRLLREKLEASGREGVKESRS